MHKRCLSLLIVFIALIAGCKSEDPTPVVPEGDPIEIAREFMKALYSGDVDRCRVLTTSENRDQIEELCQASADANATIDLSNANFVVIAYISRLEVVVEMSGTWQIAAFKDEQMAIESHDTSTEPPVLLRLFYQDGQWRFDYFEDNP